MKNLNALHPAEHDEIGNTLIKNYNFRTTRGDENLYIYLDGNFQNGIGESVIREKTKELKPDCKQRTQNETIEHIKTSTFIDREELGLPKEEIVLENGIFNLEKRELREKSPKENPLIKVPIKHDPDADCDKILQFFKDIFKEEDIPVVQEMIGYCLWKEYPIHKAFILLGEGANGKTTFINLLNRFLDGDNVSSRTLHDLIYDRFSKVYLYGKLANLTAETPNTKLSQADAFKRLTGKDPIKAEKKYQQPFFFKNYAKLVFAANELPETEDMTYAFFRRWAILEFPYRFTGKPNDGHKDEDPYILDKICTEEEFSGLLNWALDGLDRLFREGEFTETKSRENMEEFWIKQTDSIRAFVRDEVETDENIFVTKGDFYEAYKDYCDEKDAPIETKQKIGLRLPTLIPKTTEVTPEVDGKRQKSWANISLKSENYQKYNHEKGSSKDKQNIEKLETLTENENTRQEEIHHLLEDGMGRTPRKIAEELDMELGKVESILDSLYEREQVKKKEGSEDQPLFTLA